MINTFLQPVVRLNTRIDSSNAPVLLDGDDGRVNVGVTALDGGGYVVHWVTDTDGDLNGDGLAVQRYAANGTKQGGVTVLQGISPSLLTAEEIGGYDLQALSNGGYALTYALGLEGGGRGAIATAGAPNQIINLSIVGRPEAFYVQSPPANASFALQGTGNNGSPLTIPLMVGEFGEIRITNAILDQFSVDNRMNLQVTGLTQGQSTNVSISVLQDVTYNPAAALVGVAASQVVAANGFGILFTTTGRPESFHINSATFANGTGPGPVIMQITPAVDFGIDLTGIAGATRLPSGTIQITGVLPDASGNYRVPAALLSQIGTGDAQTILIVGGLTVGSTLTGTIGSRPAITIPEGLFVQTFNSSGVAVGDSGPRIDTGTAPVLLDGDAGRVNVGVTALDGGGYVIHWVTDTNGDLNGDGLAVQRYAANGTKQGGVTVLQGLSQELLTSEEIGGYDLQVLSNGGYALTYSLGLEGGGRGVTVTGGSLNQTFNLVIVGRPEAFYVPSPPANASFALTGVGNNGSALTVPLTVSEFGEIRVTKAILDQFSIDNRMSLQVIGLTQGQSANISISVLQDVTYNLASSLVNIADSEVVSANGNGVLATTTGRPESFRIDSATFANGTGPGPVTMQITAAVEAGYDLTGIAGATRLPTGTIQITGVMPDASGNYRVPAALLSQIGTGDAQTILIVGGLTAGSTLTGTIGSRPAIAVPEGVFVQTFNSSGVALGTSGPRIDTGSATALIDGDDEAVNVGVTALDGGGFAIHWVTDADSDYNGDGFAVQRYAANGTKQGSVTVLQGLSSDLLNSDEVSGYDLQVLSNGGFALTYALGLEGGGRFASITASAANQTINIPVIGRPEAFYVQSPPANARFTLQGVGNDGAAVSIPLTVGAFGEIRITNAILDQLGIDNRMNLQVTGLTQGQSANISISVLQDVTYNPATALASVAASQVVSPSGAGVLFTTSGRPESFRIDSATFANGTGPGPVTMQITPAVDFGIDLTGIAGATRLPTGSIQITGVMPDANGNYRVPTALLSQIGSGDAQTILIVGGLTAGSTLTGTISSRPATPVAEGVFVQTFNSSGVANPIGLDITGTVRADALVGTAQADILAGDAGTDTLTGAGGNDQLDGGAGADRAIFSATRAQSTVTVGATALTVTSALDGTDTLARVEQMQFADGLFSFTFRAPGAAVIANFNPASGWTTQDLFPRHIADVNGDGFADVVGFGFSGVLVSFGSASGTFSTTSLVVSNFGQTAGWTNDNLFHRELADVNGDGRADIVGFGFGGTLVSLANANGTFANPTTGIANFGTSQGWSTQNGFARTVADVNGDGRADIVGFGTAGTLVSLGNGNGTFQTVQTGAANFGVNQGWANDTSFRRELADVNGDGRDDIIGFGTAGTLVALSNGNGTFGTAQLVLADFGVNQGWSNNDAFPRMVIDVNGDDIADIVGFGVAGTLIAFGKGDGTFTNVGFDLGNFGSSQGWTSNNTFQRTIADIDNDGLADLIGFGAAGVLVGLNQGDFLI